MTGKSREKREKRGRAGGLISLISLFSASADPHHERAERAAFLEVAVQWVEAHPEIDVLPSAEAWPLAVEALAAFGIEEPNQKAVKRT